MVNNSKVKPLTDSTDSLNTLGGFKSKSNLSQNSTSSNRELNDLDSLSTIVFDETSYLKLKPFSKLDPTLGRLLTFLNCFGLNVNFVNIRADKREGCCANLEKYLKITVVVLICLISGEVVYDVNVRQSKLLAEQKRSTPLLTFVIVFYSWLSLIIPVICDISLILVGTQLFTFYSRTTSTVCNGKYR